MIPAWLQAHLEALGRWNVDGVARTLTATRCRRCHAPLLTGLDADRCALPVTVDPDPVDTVGELTALLTGRATLNLVHTGGHKYVLNRRTKFQISAPRKHPVLAEHACGLPLGKPEEMPAPSRPTESEDKCPY